MSSSTLVAEPGTQEIVMTRVFDAPRDLVFRTMLDPQLIPKWWGPRRLATVVETMDVRPGGKWRYLQKDEAGNEFAFNGEYREVSPPDRVVSTFEFEGVPGHIAVDNVTLEEHDGQTTLTIRTVFASVEDRDGMLNSGMEGGATESHDRLAELLAEISGK
ncbi:MAG: hypothetical protein QOK05_534 [Chloroflexota bacterium]|jgi:uncharacterized protein YndB with AHSA1/START domain|nr:hypothetical protein [Chloroflexota bacterium]